MPTCKDAIFAPGTKIITYTSAHGTTYTSLMLTAIFCEAHGAVPIDKTAKLPIVCAKSKVVTKSNIASRYLSWSQYITTVKVCIKLMI